MHFLLLYDYVENAVERRAPFRDEHLKLARAAHERGELLLAGAFGDPVDGAALVFRADNRKTVEDFATHDPYVRSGVVKSWRIRPWTVVIGG
jgi:uncharacterized protein YciI